MAIQKRVIVSIVIILNLISIGIINAQEIRRLEKLTWSTYIDDNNISEVFDIAIDSAGHLIAAGVTTNPNFRATPGKYSSPNVDSYRIFIMKFTTDGEHLWTSIIGGARIDRVFNVAIDSENNIWAGGESNSSNFPTTQNAYQNSFSGGSGDAIAFKLSEDGTRLLYSTYIGTSNYEAFVGCAVDKDDNIWFAGRTNGTGLRVTNNAYQSSLGGAYDGLLVKINSNYSIDYVSYFGIAGDETFEDITLDSQGNPIVTGIARSTRFNTTNTTLHSTSNGKADAYIVKFNKNTYDVEWATFWGGSEDDYGYNVTVDENDNVIANGYTYSRNFTTSFGAHQRELTGPRNYYLAKLSADGQTVLWSTYYGGSAGDGFGYWYTYRGGIEVDRIGNIIFGGTTLSLDLPTDERSFQRNHSGNFTSLIAIFNTNGRHLESTYLGGSNEDYIYNIILTEKNEVYAGGRTKSIDYPISDGAYLTRRSNDFTGFITKFGDISDFVPDKDTIPPDIASVLDDCQLEMVIDIFDDNLDYVKVEFQNNLYSIREVLTTSHQKITMIIANNTQSGSFKLIAYDKEGNETIYEGSLEPISPDVLEIVINYGNEDELDYFFIDGAQTQVEYCLPITFINHSLQNIRIKSSHFSVNEYFSYSLLGEELLIEANSEIKSEICFITDLPLEDFKKLLQDSLIIITDCFDKIVKCEVLLAEKEREPDLEPPDISSRRDDCDYYIIIDITDDYLDYVTIEEHYNLKYSVENISSNHQRITLTIIDNSAYGKFKIIAYDREGNFSIYEDILSPLNFENIEVSFNHTPPNDDVLIFESDINYILNCQHISILNKSNNLLRINSAVFTNNSYFSVPQNQLPIIIHPNSSISLEICVTVDLYIKNLIHRDTLKLYDDCAELLIPCQYELIPNNLSDKGKCDLTFVLNQITDVENPIIEKIINELQSVNMIGDIHLSVYNLPGQKVKHTFFQNFMIQSLRLCRQTLINVPHVPRPKPGFGLVGIFYVQAKKT